jgi:hypothetical protein
MGLTAGDGYKIVTSFSANMRLNRDLILYTVLDAKLPPSIKIPQQHTYERYK